jgi:hypothetical protein
MMALADDGLMTRLLSGTLAAETGVRTAAAAPTATAPLTTADRTCDHRGRLQRQQLLNS